MDADLRLALELADLADEITMRYFCSEGLSVDTKADRSPVSIADRQVEEVLRATIRDRRPTHAIIGEEMGESDGIAARWILDPIDGTRNYIRGVPVFATLIALEREGEIALGVVSAPALGRRWWASRGEGAYANGQRLHVSPVGGLDTAYVSYGGLDRLATGPFRQEILELAGRCWTARALGDFWSHVLVAEGALDAAVEVDVCLWDLAPLKVIVEEAGGRFTDLDGACSPDHGSAVSTNGRIHDDVLAVLHGRAVAVPSGDSGEPECATEAP